MPQYNFLELIPRWISGVIGPCSECQFYVITSVPLDQFQTVFIWAILSIPSCIDLPCTAYILLSPLYISAFHPVSDNVQLRPGACYFFLSPVCWILSGSLAKGRIVPGGRRPSFRPATRACREISEQMIVIAELREMGHTRMWVAMHKSCFPADRWNEDTCQSDLSVRSWKGWRMKVWRGCVSGNSLKLANLYAIW